MKIYVNVNAGHDGNGTEQMPFRHINDAAKIAQPGDEVWVAPGVYREYVDPVHAGREDARITYRSVEPLGAVITGAERIQSWVPYKENVWVCRVANSLFGNYNPYTTMVYGDWYFAKADKHTGCVYLNNRALYEAGSVEECIKAEVYECSWVPEESTYKWYTEQDQEKDETVIYANFHGADPNEENVEINVRRECFMPSKTGVGYITVSGFVVTKAATTWLPKSVPAAVVLLPVALLPVLQTSALLSGPLLSSVFLQLAHPPHIPALLYQSLKRSAMLHCIFSTSSSLYTPLLLLICCHVSLKHCMASL